MKSNDQNKFPAGWDEIRVNRLIAHYEAQNEAEAMAEDEAAFENDKEVLMGVPRELVSAVRELIAKHQH